MMRQLLFSSLLVGLVVFGGSVSAESKLVIPNPTYDFGKTSQFATITHTFWLKAEGDDTVRIVQIYPGCGCTQAPIEDSVIAPGDSVALDIQFDTGRFRGYTTKKPHVVTNLSDEKHYMVIHAELIVEQSQMSPLGLAPLPVDVSQIGEKKIRRKATFTMVNKSDRDYQISLVESNPEYFTVSLPPSIAAGDTARGEIEVTEGFVNREFQRSFTISINDDLGTRFTIPVRRMYRSLLSDD